MLRIVLAVLILSPLCMAQEPSPHDIIADTPAARPIPDPALLMKSVLANQKQLEKTVLDYIFLRDAMEEELDGDGRVKKTTVSKYETFFAPGGSVSRLLSRNGKPLDEKAQKKEDERVQKQVKEQQEKQAKREREEEAGKKRKDQLTIETFLRACRVVNARREVFRGREVIAFDFEPNPTFKPHGRAEEVAQKLGGTFWVDEDARQVVRLEARLLDTVKFGGFLASLHKGAAMIFEQQRINDEIWLPSLLDANVSLRILFKGKRQHIVEHYTNYRKFRVETAIKPVDSE